MKPTSGSVLSREEFARRFAAASKVLWCIAAGQTGDRSLVEDICQQAAIVALERLSDFDPSTSFLAWMAQIVRYTAMNENQKSRRRRTRPRDPSVIDGSRAVSDAPERDMPISRFGHLQAEQNTFDDQLLGGLRTLDPVARSCLLLRVVLDSPYKEISLVLGIPPGTAMSHVDRARKALRVHLLEREARERGSASGRRTSIAAGLTGEAGRSGLERKDEGREGIARAGGGDHS
jgi:RNA polymerase sigma-70 factor, ECF subfamily